MSTFCALNAFCAIGILLSGCLQSGENSMQRKSLAEGPCNPGTGTEKKGASASKPTVFRLKMGIGSGRNGFNTLTIRSNGTASYLYHQVDWLDPGDGRGQAWRIVYFEVSDMEISEIVRLLTKWSFDQLDDRYFEEDVLGGQQAFIAVDTDALTKTVVCNNKWPRDFVYIQQQIQELVLRPRIHMFGEGIVVTVDMPVDMSYELPEE